MIPRSRVTPRCAAGLCFVLLALSPSLASAGQELPDVSAQSPWTLRERNDDADTGYVLYSRKPDGSDFSEYRLEAVVDSPPDVVAVAAARGIADPDFRPRNTVKTILRNDDGGLVVHSHIEINAPFIADRDVVTRVEQAFDAETQTHRLTWSATDEGPPPRDGVVRLGRSTGYWSFSAESEGRTRAVYVNHTDTAGTVPAWIVNSIMSDTMVQGIEELRRVLGR